MNRIALLIVVIAVSARLYGLGWGLPHVYEEAVPLKRAWLMWGWGPDESFDLNPHFFNYPSLAFYVQFAGQATLYGAMRAAGRVASAEDFRVRYHTDPSPFYVLGRLINLVFGALTVFVTYGVGRRAAGGWVGAVTALLLALNLYHISRSQMVEVDVPLTLFVALAMLFLLRLTASPTRANHLLAGAAIGLAAATKYTGALLLVSLVVAHVVSRRRPERTADPSGPSRVWLVIAALVSIAVFLAASPYVILDFSTFASDFAAERSHMRLGHFGLGDESGWAFYVTALGQRIVGWPVVVLMSAGIAISLVRRCSWSLVLLAFAVPYFAAIGSWAMAADRYALPLLPLVLVYASFGADYLARRIPLGGPWQKAALVVAVIILAAPIAGRIPRHLRQYETDSRTLCLEWIENHVPAGSFIVSEAYGPPIDGPVQYWQIPGDIRPRWYEQRRARPFYAFYEVPMFQVETEQAEAFYDLRLYRDADVVITTGAVRSRYTRDPDRYPRQVAFYDDLGAGFEKSETIDAAGKGSTMTVYRSRAHEKRFADRRVAPPPQLQPRLPLRPHWQGSYYYRMSVNYEAFSFFREAIAGYESAIPFTAGDSEVYREVAYGMIRCLTMTGEVERALSFIEHMRGRAPAASDARFLDNLERGVREFGER